jgi:hypothetical protein
MGSDLRDLIIQDIDDLVSMHSFVLQLTQVESSAQQD